MLVGGWVIEMHTFAKEERGGFPFEKWAQIKTFWQLLWNSSQSFPYPDEDKNCSLLFHKLALLFCEEYRCTSFPHFLLPVSCFTQTVVSSRFFLTFYTRGNLLIKILEFMKLIHCFGLKKTKSNEVVGLSIICFTSLGYRKKKDMKIRGGFKLQILHMHSRKDPLNVYVCLLGEMGQNLWNVFLHTKHFKSIINEQLSGSKTTLV